ncbi:transposase domain-containing protein [Escherichia coli]
MRQSRHRRPLPAHLPREIHAWSQKKAVARSVAVSWIIWGKSALNSWNW